MRIRLNTKYIRIRVAIWVSIFVTFTFLFSGIKVLKQSVLVPANIGIELDNSNLEISRRNEFLKEKALTDILIKDKVICLFGFSFIFGLVAVAGILTYKEKYFRLDRNRWSQEGLKPKLEVIGDWIIK